ncbi:MAG: type II secretion system protein [Pseudomonadota bacterium]
MSFHSSPSIGAQAGISLIELVMFMVIVSVGLAGILSVMNMTARVSADPLLRKQAVAIAESLLEEIELQPFTYCDPDDAQAAAATSSAGCTGGLAGSEDHLPLTFEAGETRYADPRFDNVSDYNGFAMSNGIVDITNTAVAGLETYSASVTITQVGTSPQFAGLSLPNEDVLKIDVRVTSGSNTDITVSGFRFRYAPNVVP